MEITEFMLHQELFYREFNLDTSPAARADKLFDEVNEFATALVHESKEAADDEALDVLICAISNVTARGIKNPLHAAYLKLERTAKKYRRQQCAGDALSADQLIAIPTSAISAGGKKNNNDQS